METTVQRIKQYLDFKGISIRQFEIEVGFSNGSFSSQYRNNKTIGVDKLENILHYYTELNPDWLLTGRGSMLRQAPVTGKECAEKMAIIKEKMQEREEIISLQRHRIKSLEEEVTRLSGELSTLKKHSPATSLGKSGSASIK